MKQKNLNILKEKVANKKIKNSKNKNNPDKYLNNIAENKKEVVYINKDGKLDFFNNKILEKIKNGFKVFIIAGPSSSGKSFVSKKLKEFLESKGYNVLLVSLDNFYKKKSMLYSFVYGSFDHIRLFDYKALNSFLKNLIEKREALLPIYSFKEKDRIGYQKVQITNDTIIIIEGLYPFILINKNFLKRKDVLKIYIDSEEEELLVRRIVRDPERTKESIGLIIENLTSVFPYWKIFGEKQKNIVNLIIKNNYDVLKSVGTKIIENDFEENNKRKIIYKVYDFVYESKNKIWVVREYYKPNESLFDFYSLIVKDKHSNETYKIELRELGKISKLHLLIQNLKFKFLGVKKRKVLYITDSENVVKEIALK
jgi:uridine kinase